MKRMVGIDPGLSGAIAVIGEDGSYLDVIDMPTMASGPLSVIKRRVNAAEVAKFLASHGPIWHAIIERVSARPGEGVCSVFSFGHSAGVVEGVVASLMIPYTLVTPPAWKGSYGLAKDKEQSRLKAITLFPAAPLQLKKYEGRAEALLLARYGIMHHD